ncbi:hypothetical protein CANTEDRAFT_113313 [Yamadazyma tenuis ATCC 10573]|uniref:Protein RCR2 n=1 Tax=Candida tenuis (strain ATCC 10573 / BCRC 21748 / CBS 615 / JCM 9827 / NBRC 10315 / NRRL Y-1498 / VKM Y-70) TaxID=590646 RepID=G3B1W1_CANTC|nr:uncharacterized protein CANTEDRAFT_113313 [Yamadazyma tenuis ATCC 10573]EGV64542.1 hypothetical protein CANTEDRAFT_113313 [Yamadazyma tenuis ATCC 10573]
MAVLIISNSMSPTVSLTKRYGFDSSNGARWAFFGIFLAVILLVVVGTIRVNKKRSSSGLQPIYGTRWMTPPSYVQSQTQYNQPSTRNHDSYVPQTYVPTYTERANDQDMGYYDATGEFHPNPNAKVSTPYTPKVPGVSQPSEAHRRATSNSDGIALSEIPAVENATDSTQHRRQAGEEEDLYNFTRPSGPPPATQ